MWGPLIEKVWAKVKGAWLNADGGIPSNALRVLTGAPAFSVTPAEEFVDDASLQAGFDALKASDEAGYL